MVNLIATEHFPYAGKALEPGDRFEETEAYGMILVALGKAKRDDGSFEPFPPDPDDLESLRARARALGVSVDGRWRPARLREAIAEASRYHRRDLRAED